MDITVTLFGWRWSDPAVNAAALRELNLPALAWLWGRGRAEAIPVAAYDGWLASCAGVDRLPEAPLLLAAAGIEPAAGCWLRCDPVTLELHNDQLVLQELAPNAISSAESAALLAVLQNHFAADGWEFCAPQPGRWFVRLPVPPQVSFASINAVRGRAINAAMPEGPDALHWHSLLNEIQMVLYNHPVNDARSAAGLPLVSGVWFSGQGDWPLAAPLTAVAPEVHGNDVLLQAVQHHAEARCVPVPAVYQPGIRHLVLQGALMPLQGNDPVAWFAHWQALETDWFAPLLTAWRSRKLQRITLVFPELGQQRTLTQAGRWQFWRRAELPR